MSGFAIREVDSTTIDDLCRVCVPAAKRDTPALARGIAAKRIWARGMLGRGACAKIAYSGSEAVGLIQYEPLPEQRVVHIHCIFVADQSQLRKGAGRALLSRLIEETRQPQAWFQSQPADALVTRTFPGELPGQMSAQAFFSRMGFKPAAKDPCFLSFAIAKGYSVDPAHEKRIAYVPHDEDRGRAVLISGPSFCPYVYWLVERAEQAIKSIAPDLPIRQICAETEPEEATRRGFQDQARVIVNARLIQTTPLDKDGFRNEVKEALVGAGK